MALVKAGADVHCTDNDGYGSRAASSCRLVRHSAGRTIFHSGRSGRSACWAVQVDGAALGVEGRPNRDGEGAGQGGCGRVLQGHRRVRFLEAASSGRWFATVRGGRSVRFGWSCRSSCLGCAGRRRCTGRRSSATRRRRWHWPRRARTCTARPTMGTVIRLHPRVGWFATVQAGRSAHSGWSCTSACFGCAGGQRCTSRRIMATRRRRWRWSRRARTCAAEPLMGTVVRLPPRVGWFATVRGRTVRPLEAELQRCLFGLCRTTALHLASNEGPHGDGGGAGEGGRGRALQGQCWVRFSGLHPRVGGSPQCGADGPLGAVL
jgi:hypothetical protein